MRIHTFIKCRLRSSCVPSPWSISSCLFHSCLSRRNCPHFTQLFPYEYGRLDCGKICITLVFLQLILSPVLPACSLSMVLVLVVQLLCFLEVQYHQQRLGLKTFPFSSNTVFLLVTFFIKKFTANEKRNDRMLFCQ